MEFSADDEDFRGRVREWLAANLEVFQSAGKRAGGGQSAGNHMKAAKVCARELKCSGSRILANGTFCERAERAGCGDFSGRFRRVHDCSEAHGFISTQLVNRELREIEAKGCAAGLSG